ncbi:DUF5916 domain-containing protein [Pseudochryseolinea flava]|uniref:Hydrolase n=1 Tax=Pseudochryseolinea flava TaxID=2059302 RepID=A0A364Y531_9BACT|nr:DUF5916 domain-containing protein [Pseudochryseolinea flava]RAW01181.1 hypothetical protein DQQ10_09705 [Pseudochryseolinea flava]
MKTFVFLMLLSTATVVMHAQQSRPVMLLNRTDSPLKIDGVMDEDDWQKASPSSPFLNKWPLDSGYAKATTEVRMLFDNSFIYVGVVNYQSKQKLIIPTLKRDQTKPYWNSDGFAVVIEPIGEKTNGFFFAVNAGGAEIEGTVGQNGALPTLNENWDNKWYSNVKIHDDRWIVEMAIPFTSLRFDKDNLAWGLNFIRNDMENFVFSTWSHVPLQFDGMDLGYLGTMKFSDTPTPRRSKVILIPYAASAIGRNHEDGEPHKSDFNVGLDAKVALTSSLNLDLTLHPDFSNVEVDKQMTNVTRYSLLFPERRGFFLENADLFTGFGSWMVKPFFSRKIGLVDGDPVPVMAGARISGNLTRGLRVGIMDVQTDVTDEISAANYFVTAIQQRVCGRSNVRLLATNRQTTRVVEGDKTEDYDRTFGGEFTYNSSNGQFNATARTHVSFSSQHLQENEYYSVQAGFLKTNWYGGGIVEKVGKNYVNSLGFIPRLDNYDAVRDTTFRIGHYNFNHWFGLMLYPKKKGAITMIEPNTWGVTNFRTNGEFLERFTSINTILYFRNTARFVADVTNTHVRLPFPADVLDNDRPIPVDFYQYTQYTLRYTTDARKMFNAEFSLSAGNFYNGTRTEYGITLNMRKQPWGNFGLSYLQNDIRLPSEYGSAKFYLIGPNAEVSITNKMWWTTFVQYNTQAENFNVNSRFQWRFKPMSDLFIVYSDNYTCNDFVVKNRGLVVKLTYWISR